LRETGDVWVQLTQVVCILTSAATPPTVEPIISVLEYGFGPGHQKMIQKLKQMLKLVSFSLLE
jgi:hypothetical protein